MRATYEFQVQVIESVDIPYQTRILHRAKTRPGLRVRCSCGWRSKPVDGYAIFAIHEAIMERDYHRASHPSR